MAYLCGPHFPLSRRVLDSVHKRVSLNELFPPRTLFLPLSKGKEERRQTSFVQLCGRVCVFFPSRLDFVCHCVYLPCGWCCACDLLPGYPSHVIARLSASGLPRALPYPPSPRLCFIVLRLRHTPFCLSSIVSVIVLCSFPEALVSSCSALLLPAPSDTLVRESLSSPFVLFPPGPRSLSNKRFASAVDTQS